MFTCTSNRHSALPTDLEYEVEHQTEQPPGSLYPLLDMQRWQSSQQAARNPDGAKHE